MNGGLEGGDTYVLKSRSIETTARLSSDVTDGPPNGSTKKPRRQTQQGPEGRRGREDIRGKKEKKKKAIVVKDKPSSNHENQGQKASPNEQKNRSTETTARLSSRSEDHTTELQTRNVIAYTVNGPE